MDEVANAAFWVGLVLGITERYGDVSRLIRFEEAKGNFLTAARSGIRAGFRWLDDEVHGARDLIATELLPLAAAGLESADVDQQDINRYLTVIGDRVERGNTGSRWMIDSLSAMRRRGSRPECLAALTAATVRRQAAGLPGHLWAEAQLEEAGAWHLNYLRVEQVMTTQLFTVHEDELVSMAAFIMDRKQIRHVLVEDDTHKLVGLISYRSVLRLIAHGSDSPRSGLPAVSEIMERDPVSVSPSTHTLEALSVMRENGGVVPACRGWRQAGRHG